MSLVMSLVMFFLTTSQNITKHHNCYAWNFFFFHATVFFVIFCFLSLRAVTSDLMLQMTRKWVSVEALLTPHHASTSERARDVYRRRCISTHCPPAKNTSPKRTSVSSAVAPDDDRNDRVCGCMVAGCAGRNWRQMPSGAVTAPKCCPRNSVVTLSPGSANPQTHVLLLPRCRTI